VQWAFRAVEHVVKGHLHYLPPPSHITPQTPTVRRDMPPV
jgi:hypothetical protein